MIKQLKDHDKTHSSARLLGNIATTLVIMTIMRQTVVLGVSKHTFSCFLGYGARSQRQGTKHIHGRSSALIPSGDFHSNTVCRLNRFLFDPCEVNASLLGGDEDPTVTLAKDDYRTVHAAKILNLHNGDRVRAGLVNSGEHPGGSLTDEATIQWIPEGKIKKSQPTKTGNPPGSICFTLHNLMPPPKAQREHGVSLILAIPRPLQLGRILPMIAQLGVDDLVLTEARKVPRDYFGSHLLRKPDALRERLIEGLCQAGADVRLPNIHVTRNLRRFLSDELDDLFPSEKFTRVIAHPQRNISSKECLGMRDVEWRSSLHDRPRVVLAVGPEGGWEEPDELHLLKRYGFQRITLGTRVLRSDVAVISLLTLAHDFCHANAGEQSDEDDFRE